jgi:hypothetical protein
MKEKDEIILTPNLWLAGYITHATKCECRFQHNGSMLLFALPKTEAVTMAMADFNNGALIPAIEYAEIAKRLRHEMYLKKNERGKGRDDGYERNFNR